MPRCPGRHSLVLFLYYLAPVESAVASRPDLDITGRAPGSAGGNVNKSCPQSALRKSADHTLIESNLWCYGRNPLTTRCFTRKVNTHFYHARPATCPVRPYTQCAGHSSIPDGSIPPRSILAQYDDSTSPRSSSGDSQS